MGDISAINSIENTTKTITRLSRFLRSKFFRDFKDAKLKNQSLNLTTSEIWLGNKVAELFNPISSTSVSGSTQISAWVVHNLKIPFN